MKPCSITKDSLWPRFCTAFNTKTSSWFIPYRITSDSFSDSCLFPDPGPRYLNVTAVQSCHHNPENGGFQIWLLPSSSSSSSCRHYSPSGLSKKSSCSAFFNFLSPFPHYYAKPNTDSGPDDLQDHQIL